MKHGLFNKIALNAVVLAAFTALTASADTVAKIGETEYKTLDAAITAVQDGGTIVVNAGDYKLNGSLSYAGKAFTIQSAEGAKVSFDMSAAVALHDAKITFTGVTFDYKTNKDYIGLQHAGTLVYNDCAIDGRVFLYAASETFNRCTFTQTAEDYNVWTYGAKEVAFNGCTFKNAGKTVNAYIEVGNASSEPQKIKLADCKVESSKSNKAVLNIKNKTQAYEVVLSGKNEVSGIDANETTKSAWYQVETSDSTETACKAVTVTETADDGTSKVVYEVKPYVAAYVTVTGIAGFADKKYASFADAYVAIKPTLEQYGLVEESVSAETFKSLFTDIDDNGNATLTYTISGTVVYDETDCANLLTMGRKASHYSNGHLINFKFVGATGKESDTLTVNSDITLPYEWWGEKTTTGIHFENLTITGSAPSGLYPSQKFFEGIDFSVVKCVLKGIKIYNCSNVGGSYTITDSVLDGTGAPADSYAIHLQGNETAPLSITIKGNTISGYDRGINIDQRTAVAIIEKNSISVKDKGRSCIQLTRLAKTTVSGNTLDLTGGNAITFHEGLLGLSAVPEVTISGNAVTGTGYLIYDDAAANGKAFTSDNLKLTYATDNTVAETVDTTKGVKGSTAYGTSTAVNNEVQHYAATVGTQGYDTLAAAIAAVAEGKPLTWVSETAWPVATPVYYNGDFYQTAKEGYVSKGALDRAIEAANKANAADVAKIYVRPGYSTANGLVVNAHQNIKTSIAIFGNDASLGRSDWEPCVEYPGENYHTLTKDVSIEIYNLHDGAGVWGQRLTAFTVTVTMADCKNAHEVLLNGQYETAAASVNNFTIRRCTFDGSKAAAECPVTTTSAGKVVVEVCTFANLNTDYVVNMNNKNGGKTEVSVKGCSFTSCGAAGKEVVRLTGEAEGSEVVAELDGLTFDETSKANAVIVGNKKTANNNASVRYTISKTTGTLNVYKQGATTAETTTLDATAEQPYTGNNAAAVAQVGETKYATLAEAIAAADAGATVQLIADTKENVTIAKKLTLDLNGFTLNGGTEKGKPALLVTAKVTVKDSSTDRAGTIKREDTAVNSGNGSHYVIDIQGDGWLTFESGKVTNGSGNADRSRGASLVRVGDDSVAKYPGLNIKGGTFTQDNFIVIKVDRGDLFLNGGTLTSANSYVIENWHRTTIKGGTANGAVAAWTYSDGANSSLKISGGTIDGDVTAVNYGNAEGKTAKVEISGGRVNGNLDTCSYDPKTGDLASITDAEKAAIAVSGGTFNQAVDGKYCADGFTPLRNTDGTYGVEQQVLAKIGDTEYYTMDAAFHAVKAGETIVLQRDYTTSSEQNSGNDSFTIDLNNHTWAYTGSDVESAAFEINYANVTLTVKNGKVVSASMLGLIPSASSMKGTITYDNAGLVFEKVEATANGHSGIETSGNNTGDAVTLKNSTLNVPNGYGIYFASSGKVTIENSTVNAKTMGVQVCSGSLNISGDTSKITVTGDAVEKTENDGAIEDGAAVSVVNRPGYKGLGTIAISGGTFKAKDGNAAIKAYTWENKTESAFDNANGTVAVCGGTFSTAVDEAFCAAGFIPMENADDTYGVKQGAYVAAIGETKYETLAKAIAAAKSGDTITLLADVVNTDYTVANAIDIKLASGVTLDGNGKTISGNVKVTVSSEGDVKIKDADFRGIHNAAVVSDSYKTKYGFSDDKVGTLSAIYAPKLAGALTILGCAFENCDWEAMQITPAKGAKIHIRDNVFKTSESDVVKEQLRHVHVEMAYGTGFDYEGTDIELAITDNQFHGKTKEANMGVWWVGKASKLDVTGNYYENPDAVSITLSDKSFKRENRCDLIYPARSKADVDVDDLTAVALVVKDAFNATAHKTVAAAIEAANDDETVRLLADVKENVAIAKDITFDLNGFTLNGGIEKGKPALTVTAKVTIKDSSEAQAGTIKREDTAENSGSGSHYVIDIQGDGWLTFESGNVTNGSGIVGVKGASLVRVGNDSQAKDPGLTVKGGTFKQDNFIVIKVDRGTLNLEGGTVSSANSYAIENWWNATLSGGTVNGAVASWTYSGGTDSTLKITGGTINGDVTSVTYDAAEGNVATVAISGGTVKGSLDTRRYDSVTGGLTDIKDSAKATIAVSGGTFSSSIDEAYCASGYIPTANADRTYGVKLSEVIFVNGEAKTLDETAKTILEEVEKAAKEGATVLYEVVDTAGTSKGDRTLDFATLPNGAYTLRAKVTKAGVTTETKEIVTVGVIQAAKYATTILAVPFANIDGQPVTVETLFNAKAAGLADGDTLNVYDAEKKEYVSFAYADGAWSDATHDVDAKVDPKTYTLTRGTAVRLDHTGSDTATIALVGTLPEDAAEEVATTIPAQSVGLAVNVTTADKKVSDITTTGTADVNIFVPTADGTVQYVRQAGDWKKITRAARPGADNKFILKSADVADADTVPAGTGYWVMNNQKAETTEVK